MKINYIKEICASCWLTMSELSGFSGISEQRLRDLSSGRVENLKAEEIAWFVEKLHINPAWLTKGEGDLFLDGYQRHEGLALEIIQRVKELEAPDSSMLSYDDGLSLPEGTVAKWLKKQKLPFWFIEKASETFSKHYDFIVYGINRSTAPQTLKEYQAKQEFIDGFRQPIESSANDDLINLPCLNIKGSAGSGNEVLEERVLGHFQVSRTWVRNVLNAEPGKVDIIFVDGPSMEPTLLDGELVLVDRRCHRFDNDAVYVIQYDGQLRIKRVQLKFDGGVIIKSDNPRFDPESLTQDQAESLRVIGKVMTWKFGQFNL